MDAERVIIPTGEQIEVVTGRYRGTRGKVNGLGIVLVESGPAPAAPIPDRAAAWPIRYDQRYDDADEVTTIAHAPIPEGWRAEGHRTEDLRFVLIPGDWVFLNPPLAVSKSFPYAGTAYGVYRASHIDQNGATLVFPAALSRREATIPFPYLIKVRSVTTAPIDRDRLRGYVPDLEPPVVISDHSIVFGSIADELRRMIVRDVLDVAGEHELEVAMDAHGGRHILSRVDPHRYFRGVQRIIVTVEVAG